jgi:hypothetical protein
MSRPPVLGSFRGWKNVQTTRSDRWSAGLLIVDSTGSTGDTYQGLPGLINPRSWPFAFHPRLYISPLLPPRRHQHPFVTPGVRSVQTAVKAVNGESPAPVRRSSASCKMRSYIGVLWLLATLFSSLGLVDALGSTTSDKPGFIKAPGREFTLDGK